MSKYGHQIQRLIRGGLLFVEFLSLTALPTTKSHADGPEAMIGLDDLVRILDQRHPQLAQAALAIEAAHGEAIQASRYPNPVFTVTGDEINDRTGPSGIWSPFFTQEIVRRDKRRLNIAAARHSVTEASYAYHVERFALVTRLRERYFEVLAIQQRLQLLEEAVHVERELTEIARRLEKSGQTSRAELVNQEAALAKLEAELEAARQEYQIAFRRLATTSGEPDLPVTKLAGSLDVDQPLYELETMIEVAKQGHPKLLAARVAVERTRLLWLRAEAEARPNVTLGAGYTWQGQNRSHDWGISVSLPIPVWDRNQGKIRTAQAEFARAVHGARSSELELTEQIVAAYQTYASSRRQAQSFRQQVIPKSTEALDLVRKAQMSGQAGLYDVQITRRIFMENQFTLLRLSAQAWQGAAVLSGLMLEEIWPVFPETSSSR